MSERVQGRVASEDARLSEYFQRRFAAFDQGDQVTSWNWFAFLFTFFWYFAKGLWVKGLLLLAANIGIGLLPDPLWYGVFGLWVYAGMFGNYDLYLKHRHGTQWWKTG